MAANFTSPAAFSRANAGKTGAKDTLFSWSDAAGRTGLVLLMSLVGGLTLAYWRILEDTSVVWAQPQYSHGWIVPVIGAYLLWCRRPNPTEHSHPYQVDLGVIKIDFTLVAAAAVAGGAFLFHEQLSKLGMSFLPAVALSTFCAVVVGWIVTNQPFNQLSDDWEFDFEDNRERVLIGAAVTATAMVAAVYSGFVPLKFHMPLMLAALLAYGGSLLGVALTARAEPMRRTGAETLAATIALVGASLVWIQAAQLDMMPLMRICFIVSLLAGFMLIGGQRLLNWAGPAVVFVVFMYPLPSIAEDSLLPLLQKVAAITSTTTLQVIGMPVYRDGSTLIVEGIADPLDVAEACSGLRMATIFGAMTIAMVFLIKRPWWDKFIILLSAIPVALLVNVMRIVVTALLYYSFPENEDLKTLIHDQAGFAMMPVAMGILWLELTILSNLSVAEDEAAYQGAMARN